MDVDLAQVRTFAAVAEHRNFRRAAASLAMTRQALSKRIRRLEQHLGEQLFSRGRHDVSLTDAGTRFLPHAHQLLRIADAAYRAVLGEREVLRVDVGGHGEDPTLMLTQVSETHRELCPVTSMRGDLTLAVDAVARGEIDAAFGRITDLESPLPLGLEYELAILSPVRAVVNPMHPLASSASMGPTDIRRHGLRIPVRSDSFTRWVRRFGEEFDLPMVSHPDGSPPGQDSGPIELAYATADLEQHPTPLHEIPIPVVPTPLFPWYLVWSAQDMHPGLLALRRVFAQRSYRSHWLSFDRTREWLPRSDLSLAWEV